MLPADTKLRSVGVSAVAASSAEAPNAM